MLSTPQNLGDILRRGLMELLVEKLGVPGVCMVQQSLLSLYSYNTNTGVLVDIGERTDILPIYDGEEASRNGQRQSYLFLSSFLRVAAL